MSFKNKNIVRGFPFFTHFACLPLIEQSYRQYLLKTQQLIQDKLTQYGFKVEQTVRRHNHLLGHLTLFMATLRGQQIKNKLKEVLEQEKQYIETRLTNLHLYPSKISYFTRLNKNQKCQQLTVIYLEIDQKANDVLVGLVDYLVRILLKNQILVSEQLNPMRIAYNHKSGRFQPQTFHISLFRCKNLMERQQMIKVFEEVNTQCFGTINKNNKECQISSQVQSQVNQNQKEQMRFECKLLDVSTMMAFDTTEFYEPLTRMVLGRNQHEIQSLEKEQMPVEIVMGQEQMIVQQ